MDLTFIILSFGHIYNMHHKNFDLYSVNLLKMDLYFIKAAYDKLNKKFLTMTEETLVFLSVSILIGR
jgi:hypothetical protein